MNNNKNKSNDKNANNKIIIYQLLPRLFTNSCSNNVFNGSIEQNGVGKLNDIDKRALDSIKALGATHVWYTGVIEHATKTNYFQHGIKSSNSHVVKGNAGSPYAIRDYYDIDPDLAVDVNRRVEEFEALVMRSHTCGLKVIMDFVPNHVAREYYSDKKRSDVTDLGAEDNQGMFFDPNNNFYYITGQQFSPNLDMGAGKEQYVEFPAKATGNDCFNATPTVNDWYETVKLNYGVDPWNGSKHFTPIPRTWFKMLHILAYWTQKGVDGFRCDMAHMVPVEFWQWAIGEIKKLNPGVIFIAEIYDVELYRKYIFNGGFDYLYDKVTLYDTLCNILMHKQHACDITKCWQTIDGIQDHMLNFLENHDEQRIASYQKAGDAMKTLPALIVSATLSRGPFMLYFGQELGEKGMGAQGFSGEDGRTSIFDYCSVPSVRRWYNEGKCNATQLTHTETALRQLYCKVLNLCNQEKSLSQGSFFDLMYVNYCNLDPQNHYVYLRYHGNEIVIVAVNFGNEKSSIQIEIPLHAFELLNIKQGDYRLIELLSGRKMKQNISPSNKVQLAIEAHNAVLWKMTKIEE